MDDPGAGADGYQDELPEDLDVSGFVGPYAFPDVKRRRYPGAIYLGTAFALAALWAASGDGVLVNRGFLVAAVVLFAVGAYHVWLAGWGLAVKDLDALVAATGHVGFPVGHASAQLGWRGLRSRPTWQILLYSAEDPPAKRGLVLVDAVDGEVLGELVEDNPEDWSAL